MGGYTGCLVALIGSIVLGVGGYLIAGTMGAIAAPLLWVLLILAISQGPPPTYPDIP